MTEAGPARVRAGPASCGLCAPRRCGVGAARAIHPAYATAFVALSLLSPWCWPAIVESLRRGARPAAALDAALQRHYRDKPGERAALLDRASAAIGRAARAGLAPVF